MYGQCPQTGIGCQPNSQLRPDSHLQSGSANGSYIHSPVEGGEPLVTTNGMTAFPSIERRVLPRKTGNSTSKGRLAARIAFGDNDPVSKSAAISHSQNFAFNEAAQFTHVCATVVLVLARLARRLVAGSEPRRPVTAEFAVEARDVWVAPVDTAEADSFTTIVTTSSTLRARTSIAISENGPGPL